MDTYTHSSSWEDAVTRREGLTSPDSAPNPQNSPEPFTPSSPSSPRAPGSPAGIVRAWDGLSNRGLLLAAGTVCAGCTLAALAAAAVWALRRSHAAQQTAQRSSPPPAGSEPEAGPESGGGGRVTGVEGWKTELWRPLRSGRSGFMGRLRSVPAGRTF